MDKVANTSRAKKMANISFNPFPVLKSERLTLRQLSLTDQQDVFALRADEEINQFLDRKPAETIEDAIRFINVINENIKNNISVYWAITLTETRELVGTICLFDFSKDKTSVEIGYELFTGFQGQGIMSEAIEKVINYVFKVLKFQKILAVTHYQNHASAKILTKFNFLPSKDIDNQQIDFNTFTLTNAYLTSL